MTLALKKANTETPSVRCRSYANQCQQSERRTTSRLPVVERREEIGTRKTLSPDRHYLVPSAGISRVPSVRREQKNPIPGWICPPNP